MNVSTSITALDKLPVISTLEDTFNLTAFNDTPDGAAKYNQWDKAFNIHKQAKRWIPIAATILIILALVTKLLFSNFMLFVLISLGLYITLRYLQSSVQKKEKKYLGGRWNYAGELAKKIIASVGGYYYLFQDGQMFFFNDSLCIYADAGIGGLIGYSKECIKKVNIEHVHLGSTTVSRSNTTGIGFSRGSLNGNTYGDRFKYRGTSTSFSSTKTTSNTRTHYEWKLDILTSFMQEPHITMVFPDNKHGEETAKRACALLS